jgi:hypothetical protein
VLRPIAAQPLIDLYQFNLTDRHHVRPSPKRGSQARAGSGKIAGVGLLVSGIRRAYRQPGDLGRAMRTAEDLEAEAARLETAAASRAKVS